MDHISISSSFLTISAVSIVGGVGQYCEMYFAESPTVNQTVKSKLPVDNRLLRRVQKQYHFSRLPCLNQIYD